MGGTFRDVARQLRPAVESLATTLRPLFEAEDADALADMTAVAIAGVTAWLDALEQDDPVDEARMKPVLDLIRRRALQGLSLDAMMRANRIAARVLWQEILDLPVAQELVAPLSTRMLEFSDQLTTAAERAYAAESLRGIREPEASRSALFEAVLAGRTRQLVHAASWLAAPHCVVVIDVASEPGTTSSAELDDLAAALVRETRAAYWTTRARAESIVAACPIEGADGRDVLVRRLARFADARRPLHVAVGGIGEGTSGTRDSYRDAIEAIQVGGGAVYDSHELAPLATMVGDRERARRFAHGCLYPLGRMVERSWVLPTLAAYLKCQGRLKEVAAELAVHPSTVKYRLNELRPFLDAHAADGDQAAALLLAVRVHEHLAEPPGAD
jgi:DNA-binding PucR family transcriptional regulator